ncbi:2-oxo-4-hydroxy-4-carboxy-5-ureidoimidazoline decarboxylase [Spongiactinospora sp. TRM90649]|uniref:2-oxo-4-hydroxy-4-carboxy-5-ureidoimidazoline decarboxylase n=1 Tax=Spongiactinospora sp. TRM90649 TaxID=3031114 RepID=UPI0023F9A96C|nr:2-oxo-4-hydroxy-4-carboxy-5-ureidoimidazoline decarboxylase [Spongiactinospora sp. TRM90649]MDF5756772.1 2-oxo-4-hydroxy-4-carboxy-5-ureidoimidazoline decarboxylase [Spongiactinospora sp. TRM90649]
MPEGEHDTALAAFNALSAARAREALLSCCAAARFAAAVEGRRPFADREDLVTSVEQSVLQLPWSCVIEALAAHPRIGEAGPGKAREASWSRGEQSGVAEAGEATRDALVAGNHAYERRFGHVYLVCATGRSGEEMLALLHARLSNDERRERRVVRAELAKITGLRVIKLLEGVI